jgi:hypothetical protein
MMASFDLAIFPIRQIRQIKMIANICRSTVYYTGSFYKRKTPAMSYFYI